jgi:hypothetical protein
MCDSSSLHSSSFELYVVSRSGRLSCKIIETEWTYWWQSFAPTFFALGSSKWLEMATMSVVHCDTIRKTDAGVSSSRCCYPF